MNQPITPKNPLSITDDTPPDSTNADSNWWLTNAGDPKYGRVWFVKRKDGTDQSYVVIDNHKAVYSTHSLEQLGWWFTAQEKLSEKA